MIDFIYNDGGRAEAGFKGKTGDCVARAVAIASGLPYKEVLESLPNTKSYEVAKEIPNIFDEYMKENFSKKDISELL